MSSSKASKSETAELAAKTVARLYFLDLSAGRILTSNPDGSDLKTIVNEGRQLPDGIVVDVARGHIYWTNMGNPKANDGTIDRADLDGKNVTNIVPPGATWISLFSPVTDSDTVSLVKFDPRSRMRNLMSSNRSPRVRAKLRACCTVQSPVGCVVTPPRCIRRVPCSMNTRT